MGFRQHPLIQFFQFVKVGIDYMKTIVGFKNDTLLVFITLILRLAVMEESSLWERKSKLKEI
jgi:hypothetical protein